MLSVFFKIVYYRLLPEPRNSGDCHPGAYCDAGLVTSNYTKTTASKMSRCETEPERFSGLHT
jgi:hypothetical protein